jgi:hypothetical protein
LSNKKSTLIKKCALFRPKQLNCYDDRQFDKLVHPLPVIGKYQNNAQPEEDGADAEKKEKPIRR